MPNFITVTQEYSKRKVLQIALITMGKDVLIRVDDLITNDVAERNEELNRLFQM